MPPWRDTSASDPEPCQAPRPYRAPRLLVYGAMASLTAAGSKGATEGGPGMAPAAMRRP